jgi:hypothetical protein
MAGETIQLSTEGPHSPQYTRNVAAAAAEAVRVLNHATMNNGDEALAYPADAESVIRSVAAVAQRLPQLLEQLQGWLTGELQAGRLQAAYGPHAGDPAAAVAATGGRLLTAAGCASQLSDALTAAAEAACTLYPAQEAEAGE